MCPLALVVHLTNSLIILKLMTVPEIVEQIVISLHCTVRDCKRFFEENLTEPCTAQVHAERIERLVSGIQTHIEY